LSERGEILDYWSSVIEIINSIEGIDRVTSDRELTKLLKGYFRGSREGEIGIFDPKAKGGCVRLLLVPCSISNFYERAFDVLDIASQCNMRIAPILRGVMFLPVSWSQSCEQHLARHVVGMLQRYKVSQICVKFPLSAFPRCW
jgi:hypothetical protein